MKEMHTFMVPSKKKYTHSWFYAKEFMIPINTSTKNRRL
jgi:hypothetical protein